MNLLQESKNTGIAYTDLKRTFEWLEISAEDYDWHVADIVGGWVDLCEGPAWITGKELSKQLKQSCEFDWAVFSAYPVGTIGFKSELPYADGNPKFWTGVPSKQLVDSKFELVFWDSGSTLYISLPDDLANNVLKNVPNVMDLDLENDRTKC